MINPVGVVLLAAGASSRMGRCKQLLPINNTPAVRHCVGNIIRAGIEDIVVVVGHERWRVAAALADLPVCLAVNDELESDMARSAEIGVNVMPQYVTGIMVALTDHPMVGPKTYEALRQRHERDPDAILVPRYQGRGGHPTLFPAASCRLLENRMPLNRLLARQSDRVKRFDVDDPGVVRDMDTREDYRQMLDLAAGAETMTAASS